MIRECSVQAGSRTHLTKTGRDMSSCAYRLSIASIKRGSRTMSYSPFLSRAAAAFWLTACTSTSRPLATVPAVDLDRYYGRWYEIARLPNRFQAMCVSDTQATYRPDGNPVAVLNQCQTATGLEQAKGIAKVVAGSRGARLKVSVIRPFYGDYRILDLAPDYRWV